MCQQQLQYITGQICPVIKYQAREYRQPIKDPRKETRFSLKYEERACALVPERDSTSCRHIFVTHTNAICVPWKACAHSSPDVLQNKGEYILYAYSPLVCNTYVFTFVLQYIKKHLYM